jgi:hypothetical protein
MQYMRDCTAEVRRRWLWWARVHDAIEPHMPPLVGRLFASSRRKRCTGRSTEPQKIGTIIGAVRTNLRNES